MDGRNDEAKNQYRLRNRKHKNRNGGLSINKHGSNNKEEEEEEDDRPHQRLRVDKAHNGDPEENLDVSRVIDFEAFALNPEEVEGGNEENNGQSRTRRKRSRKNSKQSRTRRRRSRKHS